jgi:hypothetical protein
VLVHAEQGMAPPITASAILARHYIPKKTGAATDATILDELSANTEVIREHFSAAPPPSRNGLVGRSVRGSIDPPRNIR